MLEPAQGAQPDVPLARSSPASWTDWVLFAVLGLIWGGQFLFIKVAASVPPFELSTIRLFFGAAVLAGIAAVVRPPLAGNRTIVRDLLVLAILNNVIPFVLINLGEESIGSGAAAIIVAVVPLLTIVLAAATLREPVGPLRVAGLGAGFLGVLLVIGGNLGGVGDPEAQLGGDLAVALAAVSFALAIVYARRRIGTISPWVLAIGQVSLALPIAGFLSLATEHPFEAVPSGDVLLTLACLGVLASGIAYLIWYRLLSRWDATRASLVSYVQPIVGVALGVILLSEPFGQAALLGTSLVVGGIVLVNVGSGSRVRLARLRIRSTRDRQDRDVPTTD